MADNTKKKAYESNPEIWDKLQRSKAAKRISRATGVKHTTALRRLEAGESEQDIIDSTTEDV